MVLHLPDLETSCYEIRDVRAPSSNIDQDKTGNILRKKHSRLRTEDSDEHNNTELVRKKRKMMKSSSDNSSFVALVTATNLLKDALYLPQDLTNSVGLKRSCSEIIVRDERERSWAMDLKFYESSDTFYITRGWRSFCDDIDKKAGGVIVFNLVENGETPFLSFCSTKSINEGKKKKKEKSMELDREKKRLRCRDSTSPSPNRFVTLTLPHDHTPQFKLVRPSIIFRRENGIHNPGIITLVGKDGSKWDANLRRNGIGRMCLSKGLKDFAKASGLKGGESFTLEAILENGAPMLRLVSTPSTNDRSQQGERTKDSKKESFAAEPSRGNKTRKDTDKKEERKESSSSIKNRFVTLTLTPEDIRDSKLILPRRFMKDNDINKLGKITLLGKNRMKCFAYLLSKDGFVALGCDWKGFVKLMALRQERLSLWNVFVDKTQLLCLTFVPASESKDK